MQQTCFTIHTNSPIAPSIFRMDLTGDTSAITRPGQFINIALDGFYLRRPISVCRWTADRLTIYTDNLEVYAETVDISAATSVLMREDGSVLLLGGGKGWLYLP